MTDADRKKAQAERQRRAALRSSVIQELRQQYSDAPEEIRDRRDFQSERESRDELHRCLLVYRNGIRFISFPSTITLIFFHRRKNYEEAMMVRLNMPKRQKNSKKRGLMGMSGQLSGITHFSDITALTGGEGGQVSLRGYLYTSATIIFLSLSYRRGYCCWWKS